MLLNSQIDEKAVKENTFSQRFQYFLRKKNQELRKEGKKPLNPERLAEIVGYYEADSFHDFLYRNGQPKDKIVIEKLAEILGIQSIELEQDTTRPWRAISREEHIANGETFVDDGRDKKGKYNIYGDFDIDEYDNFIAAKEEFETEENIDDGFDKLITEIKESFYKQELTERYRLTNYFDIYKKIHDNAWTFIVNFSLLNSNGKDILKKAIIQIETLIEHQLLIFRHLIPFYETRDRQRDEVKEIFIEKANKQDLWGNLEGNLNLESWSVVERFSRQIEFIATMDYDDWTVLIGYFLLNSKLGYTPSEKQKAVLALSEELVKNPQYYEVAVSV